MNQPVQEEADNERNTSRARRKTGGGTPCGLERLPGIRQGLLRSGSPGRAHADAGQARPCRRQGVPKARCIPMCGAPWPRVCPPTNFGTWRCWPRRLSVSRRPWRHSRGSRIWWRRGNCAYPFNVPSAFPAGPFPLPPGGRRVDRRFFPMRGLARVVLGKNPRAPEAASRRQMNQGIFAIFLRQVLGQTLGRHAYGLGWRRKDLRRLPQRRTIAAAHGRGRRAFPAPARCPCLMSGSLGHMPLRMSGVRPRRVRRPLPWPLHLGSGRPGCKITTRSTLRYARVNGDEADRRIRPMPSTMESLFPFTRRGFLLWSDNP